VPRLPDLYARHPGLDVALVGSNDNLNVARREADIAIRLARPESGDFLIRKLADVGFAVYAPAAGEPPDAWVCYDEDLAHTPRCAGSPPGWPTAGCAAATAWKPSPARWPPASGRPCCPASSPTPRNLTRQSGPEP
jgi:DNA-binding transcriptional LysR family regulator